MTTISKFLIPFPILILIFSFIIFNVNGINSTDIFSSEDKPYGLSYEEHAENYWNWLISIPSVDNPYEDDIGEKCSNGQQNSNSSVFYLSGNGGGKNERTCEVPFGKSILVPILVAEVSDKEFPGSSIERLANITKNDQDGITSLYLKIDNNEFQLQDLSKYRINPTDPFVVNFPEEPLYGVEKGPSKAIADGHYIITKPLTKGEHVIHFKGSLSCEGLDCIDASFDQDIKYTLIVK